MPTGGDDELRQPLLPIRCEVDDRLPARRVERSVVGVEIPLGYRLLASTTPASSRKAERVVREGDTSLDTDGDSDGAHSMEGLGMYEDEVAFALVDNLHRDPEGVPNVVRRDEETRVLEAVRARWPFLGRCGSGGGERSVQTCKVRRQWDLRRKGNGVESGGRRRRAGS